MTSYIVTKDGKYLDYEDELVEDINEARIFTKKYLAELAAPRHAEIIPVVTEEKI
jgi:hypothetical protein